MLRILRNADYPSRPWKNGGGTTRDILVSPPGASLDEFDWRLSLAQVDRDGPFSRFDDIDRTLVLLSGAMTLHEPDRRIELVRGEPVEFPGERTMDATLQGGATLDFNVMTRRGRVTHDVRHEVFSTRTNVEATDGSTIVLFALESGLRVDGESLNTYDTAVIVAQSVVMSAATHRAAALIVRIVDFRPNVL
ncbi:MAG TPA: HutD family protein [Steroidobacteraceae bacterium]|nr:HutD family protein [Steroidobacteraceae bacterium]